MINHQSTNGKPLKILQFNSNKQQEMFRAGNDLLLNSDIDVICTQEPNSTYIQRLLPVDTSMCIVGLTAAVTKAATLFNIQTSAIELAQYTTSFYNLVEITTSVGPVRVLNVQ